MLKRVRLVVLFASLLLIASSGFGQDKLGVTFVTQEGWSQPGPPKSGGNYYTWRINSVSGYLGRDGVFQANPNLGTTLAQGSDDYDPFIVAGGYYIGFRWADIGTLEAAFPEFSFFRNPALERAGIVSYQQIRVIVKSPGGTGGDGSGGTIYPKFGGGRYGWRSRSRNTRMTLTVPSIHNNSTTRTTGSLRVYVLAGGRPLAFARYSPLSPRYLYHPFVTTVSMSRPPRGRVRTSMVLAEYNGGGYVKRDSKSFPGTVRFR